MRTVATADQQLIARHIRDQRRRGLEESTITKRVRIQQRLLAWLDGKSLLDATTDDIQQFLDECKIGKHARYAYISELHTFYMWAVHAELMDRAPTLGIVRPRVRPGLPRPIASADLEQALSAATGRERVILALAAYEGMRCIEIARLVREDILENRDPQVLIARGKGDKPRIIPLHPEAWKALRSLPLPTFGPVLRNDSGRPFYAAKISKIGNDFLRANGADATMHQLRHWFGTNLYRASGRDLLLVRDLMGHSSVTTTTVYAAFDRVGAVEAVQALSV